MSFNWRALKNPWVFIGAILSFIVLFGLGLFLLRIFLYIGDIRAGKPDPFAVDDVTKKVQILFLQKSLSEEQRTTIESGGDHPMLGNPDASVRLVEFVDYECPFSKRSAPDVRTFLARNSDHVLLTIRDFPIESVHANAMNSAISARCIFQNDGADLYWFYHDLLYENQDRLSVGDLRAYAEEVGADMDAYQACVDGRQTEDLIRQSIQDGASLGVRGTPTFFMNGVPIPGNIDLATLEALLKELQP